MPVALCQASNVAAGSGAFIAILVPILACAVAGAWNGALVAWAGVQPIVATLILMVAGRGIAANDRRGVTRAAMINQRLAADLFAGESPLGHQLTIAEREQVEVIGVVADALFDGPNRDPHPRYLFVAEQQMPGAPPTDPSFIIRHRGSLEAVTPIITRAVGEVEAGLPIVAISTMTARLALVFELETLIVRLLVSFAVISLVIAAFGHGPDDAGDLLSV